MKIKILVLFVLVVLFSCKTVVKTQKSVTKNTTISKTLSANEKFDLFVQNLKKDTTVNQEIDRINQKILYHKNKKYILLANYYDASLKIIKRYTHFTNNAIIVRTYEPDGSLIGIENQDVKGITISGTKLSYNENVVSQYKNSKMNGITKVYNSDLRKLLIKKVLLKDDEIVWRETLKPNSKTEFYHCDFVAGKPYNGIEYQGMYSNDEMYFKDGVLYKEIRYKTTDTIAVKVREIHYHPYKIIFDKTAN